ncbi:MAG: SIS domain-containing protein [Pseudolysinimonas sp.]
MTTTSGAEHDLFLREILEQPRAMRSAADGMLAQQPLLDRVGSMVNESVHPLVLTGMGSSFDAALALSSVLARAGRATICVTAAELVHFQLPAIQPGSVVVIVSQSGLSAEAVRLARQLRERGRMTIVSITNGLDSELSRLADIALDMGAGTEIGPSTKTFAATMVVLAALDASIGSEQHDGLTATLMSARLAADRLELALGEPEERAAAVASWWGDRAGLVFVGRGAGLAAAELAALVIKESAHVGAFALESAEFRHGPMEMAGPDLAVAIIDIEPVTSHLEEGLAADLKKAGAAVMRIGIGGEEGRLNRVDPVGHPLLDAALATAPLLLLAWSLSTRIAASPGAFRVGTKTTTKE